MSSSLSAPLSSALTPKKSQVAPMILLTLGLLIAVGAAAYGYIESRRTERVVIAVRDIPFGRQIVADDLALIEVPLHRPLQLAGVGNPVTVIGSYAARQIGPNDLIQSSMLSAAPPAEPVYPNGRKLERNMVPVPFALAAVGPISDRDLINIGFLSTDPTLCDREAADVPVGTALTAPAPVSLGSGETGEPQFSRAYACRLMSGVPILYIEHGEDGGIAYLEMTPTQAHALRAVQAAGATLWGERYGATSEPLLYMDRLDAAQVILPDLTQPVTTTIRIEPQRVIVPGEAASVPGAESPIPGIQP